MNDCESSALTLTTICVGAAAPSLRKLRGSPPARDPTRGNPQRMLSRIPRLHRQARRQLERLEHRRRLRIALPKQTRNLQPQTGKPEPALQETRRIPPPPPPVSPDNKPCSPPENAASVRSRSFVRRSQARAQFANRIPRRTSASGPPRSPRPNQPPPNRCPVVAAASEGAISRITRACKLVPVLPEFRAPRQPRRIALPRIPPQLADQRSQRPRRLPLRLASGLESHRSPCSSRSCFFISARSNVNASTRRAGHCAMIPAATGRRVRQKILDKAHALPANKTHRAFRKRQPRLAPTPNALTHTTSSRPPRSPSPKHQLQWRRSHRTPLLDPPTAALLLQA